MSLSLNNPLIIGDINKKIQNEIGDLQDLETVDKSSLVNALNEAFDSTLNGASRDLNNLSTTGTQKLRSLNAYANNGELLTDADGLSFVKNYAHSTFDKSKFTVVGSPTITDDGIVSGFSSSNYLTIPLIDSSKNFEIDICIKTGNSIPSTNAYIFGYVSGGYGDGLRWYSNGKLVWGIHDTNSSLHNVEFANLSVNTEYWIKLKHIDDKNYLCVSEDGVNYTENSTTSNSYTIANYFRIGVSGTTTPSDAWSGFIDLKYFSIKIDGKEVLNGRKEGMDILKPDDYTVVGTPTISADGIANISSGNYIQKSINLNNVTNYEIVGCFKVNNNLSATYEYIFSQRGARDGATENTSIFEVNAQIYNSRLQISMGGNSASNNFFYLDYKKSVYVKQTFKNGIITRYYSYDGKNWTAFSPIQTTVGYVDLANVYLGTAQGNLPFVDGSIDLNAFKIYVDGDLVYQPCLKIPYTESKTGSKIVDSIYRDRVNDMAEQFGYANYYTLLEENAPHYTVVGSPTISSDWVASGFSYSNYIKGGIPAIPTSSIRITGTYYLSDSSANNLFFQNSSTASGNLRLSYKSSDGYIFSSFASLKVNVPTITSSDKIDLEVICTATKIEVNAKINGTLYTNTATGTYTIPNMSTFAIGKLVGNDTWWLNGSIDLNSFKIYIDGKLAYEAVTEPNFTLPQVELYGLIGQRTLRDSYRNGINYWELYSNRDLEQGGSCTSGVEVTFAKPFADTNYVLSVPYSAKSATAFTPTQTGDWIAKGKGIL